VTLHNSQCQNFQRHGNDSQQSENPFLSCLISYVIHADERADRKTQTVEEKVSEKSKDRLRERERERERQGESCFSQLSNTP